jgi:hypothetical protein
LAYLAFDHVQLLMPVGQEERARAFNDPFGNRIEVLQPERGAAPLREQQAASESTDYVRVGAPGGPTPALVLKA